MQTITKTRAPQGGAFGANGEWYEGGKFIATTERAKRHGSTPKGARKLEIAPYEWAIAPEGKRSLYAGIQPFVAIRDGVMSVAVTKPEALAYYRRTLAEVGELVARFNAGDRWVDA